MADSSLDDFFAKKDRSKRSKTKKFTTTEQIAKNLEESGKRSEKPTKKDKEKNTNPSSGGTGYMQNTDQEDDEWKEVEEKETDYSGLKIQNLQISELRDDELEKEKSDDFSEDVDQQWQKDGSGPWNKSLAAPVLGTQADPEEKPKKYVAPGQRSASGSTAKSRNKTAPEIDSELHFPSLSASSDGRKKSDRSPDSEKGFESVKRGGIWTVDDESSRSPQLSLGNKYDLLSRGETS